MIEPQISDSPGSFTRNTLRQFAGLWLLFFGALAFWQGYLRQRTILAVLFALAALAVGPLGLIRPRAIRPVFHVCMAITRPIGWVSSHVILAFLFYGIFTPIALFFKLIGRDALHRKRRTDRTTYWQPKPAPRDSASYLRQA